MKKRILSIVLVLCMVMAFMPQAVVAADANWENKIWIGDTPVNMSNLSGDGWDFKNGGGGKYILELKAGFNCSGSTKLPDSNDKAVIQIRSLQNITIKLLGDATIGTAGSENNAPNGAKTYGIYAPNTNLAIEGTGTLNVYSNINAIYCNSLTVDGVNLNCSSRSTAIYTNGDFNIQNNADISAITKYGIAKNTHFDDNINEIYSNDGVSCILVKGSLNVENSVLFSKNTYCERENVEFKCECKSIFVINSITVSGRNACITGKMEVNAYTNPNDIVGLYAIMVGKALERAIHIKNGGTVEGFVDGETGQYVRGILSYAGLSFDEGGGFISGGQYTTIRFEDYEGTVREGYNLPAAETPKYELKFSKDHELTEITTDPNAKYNCYREIKVTRPTGIYFRTTGSGRQWSFYKDFSQAYSLDSTTIDLRNISDSVFVKRGWNSDWGTPNIYIQSGDWTIIPPSEDEVNYYIESGTQTIQPQDTREYAGGHIYIAENATVNIQGDGIGENWDISPINSTATAGGAVRFISGTVKNAQADMANKVYILGGNINFNLKDYSQVVMREDGLRLYKDIYVLSPCTDRLTTIHTGEAIITPEESYYYPIGDNLNLVVWTVNDLPIKYVTVKPEDGETYNLIPGGGIEGLGSEYHSLARAERYREFVPNPNYKFFRNPDESVTMNAAGSINTYEKRLDSAFYGPYLIGSTTDLDSSLRAEWSYQNDNGEKVVVGGNSLTCTIDDLSDIVNYRTYTCTVYEKAADGSEKAIGSYNAKVYVMRWEQPDTVYAAIGKEVTFTVNPSAETQWTGFLSTLKWQVNKGTGWEDIPNSNTDSYTVTITEENAIYKYRRVIYGWTIGNYDKHEASIRVEMNSPELSVTFAPEITSQPQSIKIQENDTAKHALRVSANNAESYRWQKKVDGVFTDMEGQTSGTLQVGPQDAGTYRCVVSNGSGETVSEEASVTTYPAPSCGTLSGVNAAFGQKAQFGIGIDNAPGDSGISVKWQYSADDGATWVDVESTDDSENISMMVLEMVFSEIWSDGTVIRRSEIRSSSMTINKTTADMDGWKVRCVLTDAVGVYYSNTVELHVEMPDYTVTFDTDGGTEIASKTTVKWKDKVLDGVSDPTKDGWKFTGWKYGDVTVTPQTTYQELAADATVTSIELKAQWEDIAAPTGEISIGTNSWKAFLNKITFGLFFKDTQAVTITAGDNSGEAVTISYLLSDKAVTADALAAKEFTVYTNGFDMEPNNEWIIYAKLTDKAGNVTYLSSDGIVLDNVAPVISGIENGKTYCEAQTVTVDEKYIDSVTVNGKEITLQNNQFTLPAAEGTQKIVATDKAGNVSAEITVTVNGDHTYEWQSENGKYWKKCKFCGDETAKKDIPSITINGADAVCVTQDYKFSFTLPEGATDAVYGYDFKVKGEYGLPAIIENNEPHGVVSAQWYEPSANSFQVFAGATTADGFEFFVSKTVALQSEHTDTAPKDHLCDVCGATLSEHTYEWQSENGKYWKKCKFCGDETAKKDIPNVTINGADAVCITQDYKFGITLPEGVTEATYGYEFENKGDLGLPAIIENNELFGIVPVTVYEPGENSFKVYAGAKTADGFEFFVSKTVALKSVHTDAEPKDHICDICRVTLSEHTGGEATCKAKAICDYCGEEYGEVDSDKHTGGTEIRDAKAATYLEEGYTGDKFCVGCGEKLSAGEVIPKLTHNDKDQDPIYDICDVTRSEHKGGTATCTEKAVCEYCYKEYGEPKGHNYREKVVEPTKFTMGGTQHICDICGDEYWDTFTKKANSEEALMPNGETVYHYCTHNGLAAETTVDVGDGQTLRVFLQDPLSTKKRMEDDGIKFYEITEGAEQVIVPSSDIKIVFRSDAPFKKFDQVMINGLVLDKKYYTVTEGSTVVTLNADFAKQIPTGMHLFGIISTDGVAITTFTVDDKAAADNDTKSPQTGDNSHMALWIALLFVSGGLLTVTVIKGVNTQPKRRKRYE